VVAVAGSDTDLLVGIENIIGGSGNDTLTGDASDNILRGNAGNDTMNGGKGYDIVDYGHVTTNLVASVLGTSTVTIAAGDTDTLTLIEGIIGGSGNDTLTGNADLNTLRGGAGNDTLDGSTGYDLADYGYLSTGLTATLNSTGTATVVAAAGDTDLLVSMENIVGGSGNDTLVGDSALISTLFGGAGDDLLRGMDGVDSLVGGAGIDTADYSYATGGLNASLNSTGSITLTVSSTDADILSSIENLIGGSGDDIFFGDIGANSLSGGAGNDTLSGGAGADRLSGGLGADRFSYAADAIGLADVITDFATGDVLDLSQLLSALGGVPANASSFVSMVENGGNVEVRLDLNGAAAGDSNTLLVTIENQNAAQVLAQTNFG
jgi:Ca2+-binding RTX toxin-like protein